MAVMAGFQKSDSKYMNIWGQQATERVRVHPIPTLNYTEVQNYHRGNSLASAHRYIFMDSDPELKEGKYLSIHVKINKMLAIKKKGLVGRTVL